MKIESGDQVNDGLSVTISVVEYDGEYWSSVDLHLPETDEVNTIQFYVALDGIRNAEQSLLEIISDLEEGRNNDS